MIVDTNKILRLILKDTSSEVYKYGKTALYSILGFKLDHFERISSIEEPFKSQLMTDSDILKIKTEILNKAKVLVNTNLTKTDIEEMANKLGTDLVASIRRDAMYEAAKEIRQEIIHQLKIQIKEKVMEMPEIKKILIQKL